MDSDDDGDDNADAPPPCEFLHSSIPPFSQEYPTAAPEKKWAKKLNKGDLFAALARSPDRPKTSSGRAATLPPVPVGVPLRQTTSGGKDINSALRAQEIALSKKLAVPTRPAVDVGDTHTEGCPMWGMGSMDCLRTSMGFLEEHVASLEWLQECLINHQKVLVRTRSMNTAMLDSVSRAIYMQDRYGDMRQALEEHSQSMS